jgi:hypothetical protein
VRGDECCGSTGQQIRRGGKINILNKKIDFLRSEVLHFWAKEKEI